MRRFFPTLPRNRCTTLGLDLRAIPLSQDNNRKIMQYTTLFGPLARGPLGDPMEHSSFLLTPPIAPNENAQAAFAVGAHGVNLCGSVAANSSDFGPPYGGQTSDCVTSAFSLLFCPGNAPQSYRPLPTKSISRYTNPLVFRFRFVLVHCRRSSPKPQAPNPKPGAKRPACGLWPRLKPGAKRQALLPAP